MMLIWTSEVFWDPELDQPGKPAAERKAQPTSECDRDDDLRHAPASRAYRETAGLW